MSVVQADLVIVGAGPSGLTVAAEVAAAGAQVIVLEKRSAVPMSRAGTLLPRSLELFDARGIADRFISRTCELNPHPFQAWHIWAGMHPVDWTARDSRFGFTLFLAQYETEKILADWAAESGVQILFEHDVTGIEDNGTSVAVEAVNAHGETVKIRADYVVGADGGRSITRRLMKIAFDGRNGSFTGVIADAEMPFPWKDGLAVGHNQNGWLSAFPFGPELTRIVMVHAEGRLASKDTPVTVEELNKCVSEILGEDVHIPALRSASRYSDAKRIADKLRSGRVLLVGEAARIHYPASGVGMNYCLQDAFNIGWKLALVLAGKAADSILDSYEDERRPIMLDLLDSVDSQVAIQFDFSPEGLSFVKRFEKNLISTPDVTRGLWAELLGLETAYPAPPNSHASVGYPALDFEMFLASGQSIRLYELLHRGEFVFLDLSGSAGTAVPSFSTGAVKIIRAKPIQRPDLFKDVEYLLIRPDTYVAWASADSSDFVGAVDEITRWFGPPNRAH